MFCGGAPRPLERIIRQHSALSTENFVPIIYTQNQMFANIFFDRMLNFLQNFEKRFGQIQDSYPITYYRPLSNSRRQPTLPTPNPVSRRSNKRRLFLSVAVRYHPLSPVAQRSSLLPDRRTANHRHPPASTPNPVSRHTNQPPTYKSYKSYRSYFFGGSRVCSPARQAYCQSSHSANPPHQTPSLAAPKGGVCFCPLLSVIVRFLR